jgi:hypothetical protein
MAKYKILENNESGVDGKLDFFAFGNTISFITCISWLESDVSINSRKCQCQILVQSLQEVNFYYFEILNGICCCQTN